MLLRVFRAALSRESLGSEACRTLLSDENGHPCLPLRTDLYNNDVVVNSGDENNDITTLLTSG